MEPGDRFDLDEVARRAGVGLDEARSLAALRLLAPGEDGKFGVGDVRRVRIVHACDEAGMPAEEIARAVADGKLSLAFLDLPTFRWAERTSRTYREVAAESGLSVELLLDAHEALGVIRPRPGDPALDEDIELLDTLRLGTKAGIPEVVILRTLRVYSESLRRVTAAETDVYHDHIETPLLSSGMSQQQMMEIATEVGRELVPSLDRTLAAVYRRQQEHTWTEDIIEHIESALEEAGVRERLGHPPAMCFLDLSGYTELTEERGDEAAAQLASTLAAMVRQTAGRRRGIPVKQLGDGVMFRFREASGAVLSALEMVDVAPQAGLPPAHVGVDAGPVVAQDGDYFGRTVNVAARLADRAGPGQVLVTDEVVRLSQREELTFREVGETSLKGLTKPLRVHEALRS